MGLAGRRAVSVPGPTGDHHPAALDARRIGRALSAADDAAVMGFSQRGVSPLDEALVRADGPAAALGRLVRLVRPLRLRQSKRGGPGRIVSAVAGPDTARAGRGDSGSAAPFRLGAGIAGALGARSGPLFDSP